VSMFGIKVAPKVPVRPFVRSATVEALATSRELLRNNARDVTIFAALL